MKTHTKRKRSTYTHNAHPAFTSFADTVPAYSLSPRTIAENKSLAGTWRKSWWLRWDPGRLFAYRYFHLSLHTRDEGLTTFWTHVRTDLIAVLHGKTNVIFSVSITLHVMSFLVWGAAWLNKCYEQIMSVTTSYAIHNSPAKYYTILVQRLLTLFWFLVHGT